MYNQAWAGAQVINQAPMMASPLVFSPIRVPQVPPMPAPVFTTVGGFQGFAAHPPVPLVGTPTRRPQVDFPQLQQAAYQVVEIGEKCCLTTQSVRIPLGGRELITRTVYYAKEINVVY